MHYFLYFFILHTFDKIEIADELFNLFCQRYTLSDIKKYGKKQFKI